MSDATELPVYAGASLRTAHHTVVTAGGWTRHLASIIAGWREAWNTRASNPLCAAWELAERRRVAGKAWWRRNPGLSLLAAVLSVAALTLIINAPAAGIEGRGLSFLDWIGAEFDPQPAYNELYRLGLTDFYSPLRAQILSCVLLTLVFFACQLLSRLFTSIRFALGVLERELQRSYSLTLDDMLAVTPLSAQELVVGFLSFALNRLLPPLLACCALTAVMAVAGYGESVACYGYPPPGLVASAALAATMTLVLGVSSLASSCNMLLIGFTLGLAQRSGVWAAVGALTFCLLQLWIASISIVTPGVGVSPASSAQLQLCWQGGLCGPLLLLLTAFLLYLSRRLAWLRVLAILGWPLMVTVPYTFLMALFLSGFDLPAPMVLGAMAAPLETFVTLNPWVIQALAKAGEFGTSSLSAMYSALISHWLALLPTQAAFMILAAEFARDAVCRRKWGAA